MNAPGHPLDPRDDGGAVAVIVAICIVLFAILATLVVDVGYWYNVRRQLQAAADAGALAGCRELILDKSDPEIWATVEEYVGRNAVRPADLGVVVIEPSAGGLSDIGTDFVKVTVEQETHGFFAGVLGVEQAPIRAQARAEIAYALEGRGLVPLSVPIILPGPETRAVASVDGGEWDLTVSGGSEDLLTGGISFSATVAADEAVSLPVDVDVYNSQGVVEVDVDDAARVIVRGADFPIVDVDFGTGWVVPGSSTSVFVRTLPGSPAPEGIIAGPDIKKADEDLAFVSAGTNLWRASVTLPDGIGLYEHYYVDVSVEQDGDTAELERAAVMVVRRPSRPLEDVRLDADSFTGGGTHSTGITVELHRFEISYDGSGPEYVLKGDAGGAAETGNYMVVDFSRIYMPADYTQERENPSGSSGQVTDWACAGTWAGTVFLNDAVDTFPGNSLGSVDRGFSDRFAGHTCVDLDTWIAQDKPATPQVFYIPMVEKMELLNGKKMLKVVAFAAFFVEEPYDKNLDLVRGHFIEYVVPSGGSGGDPGGSTLDVKTPHLVSEDIDF